MADEESENGANNVDDAQYEGLGTFFVISDA